MARPTTAELWICENCGSYFGSSSAGDLSKIWNVEKNTQKRTFLRSRCPTVGCANANIHRIPVTVSVPQS